jgi:exodeoxyribonuclease V gamma subunit
VETAAPCDRFAALERLRPTTRGNAEAQELLVFGLSTLTPGDRRAIELLARHLDVRLFALSPSREWWAETSTRDERRAAYRRATTDDERLDVIERGRDDNPLLVRCGLPSRDFQRWCEALDYEESVVVTTLGDASEGGAARVDDSQAKPTLLRALQRWIDRAEPAPSPGEHPWADLVDDGSMEIHACHGALRQCEALRDELLRRFAENPSLEPRHVLVMTPDVATYAPLLSAVLARDDGAPPVPVLAADLGLRATNPIADALARVVALGTERVTATALVELLGLGPVRARFDLDERDLEAIRTMVAGAQIRWAWDADDRARHDQPRSASHTVVFGLERLALGMLAPSPDGFEVIDASATGESPLVPVDVATRESAERFGKLARACLAIRRAAASLATPGTRGTWHERLIAALEALTQVGASEAWMRLKVDETLDELLGEPATSARDANPVAPAAKDASERPEAHEDPSAITASSELLFEPNAIARLVGGALELPEEQDLHPKVGDTVLVLSSRLEPSDVGREGVLVLDDQTSSPYKVRFDDGTQGGWYLQGELRVKPERGLWNCVVDFPGEEDLETIKVADLVALPNLYNPNLYKPF